MEISARAHRVIADFGTDNLAAMNEHDVFRINNCGDATIREIALYLCSIGKPFKCHDRIMERLPPPKTRKTPEDRMTLRDRFACAALTGLLANDDGTESNLVGLSYMYADSMLEARKK